MLGDSKTRCSVYPPKEVTAKVDELAKQLGMTRSAMMTYLIVQGIESYEAVKSLPADIIAKLAETVK